MRVLLQRVTHASVSVEGAVVGEIGPGLLALVGVGPDDAEADVTWLAEKVAKLRIFEDEAGKMNRSVLDGSKALLAVSQFTLFADCSSGNRPSFVGAAPPALAQQRYGDICAKWRALGLSVAEGIFAADMKVALVNDGPVTVWLDSKSR